MDNSRASHIHPVEQAGALESPLRYWFQHPRKILAPYIQPGMNVLDLGCGPGFFTTAIAELLQGSGKVIAADLQDGMLDKLRSKISGSGFEQLIQPHRCAEKSLKLTEQVDFILAFYTLHEIGHLDNIIKEIRSFLAPGGAVFIAEQKFHVPKATFHRIINKMKANGFEVVERPGVFLSRALLMRLRHNDMNQG